MVVPTLACNGDWHVVDGEKEQERGSWLQAPSSMLS